MIEGIGQKLKGDLILKQLETPPYTMPKELTGHKMKLSHTLRIGNTVLKDGKPVTLDGTMLYSIWLSETGNVLKHTYEGMPVNSLSLKNLGFEELNGGWFELTYFTDGEECSESMRINYNIRSHRFSIFDADEGHPAYTAKTIQYVHDFENLVLDLTGERLKNL
jgi:hypothetical protein